MAETAFPFDLRALEIFLAVCDGGAMAQAARRLGITQPAVSQAIAELEAATGIVLFDRAVRPLGLTAPGLLLRQRASALLAEASQIGPLLREAGRGRLRSVRLGVVDSLARALIPALSAHLATTVEETSFLSGLTSSFASALLTRQLDILLGADELEEVEGIERWTLCEEPYLLIGPADMQAPASLADLALPLVRFSARIRHAARPDSRRGAWSGLGDLNPAVSLRCSASDGADCGAQAARPWLIAQTDPDCPTQGTRPSAARIG